MGLDACIYFRAKNGKAPDLPRDLPDGFAMEEVAGNHPDGVTHSVFNYERLYDEGYERGHWPKLCWALMVLLACPEVEGVWYHSDCGQWRACTADRVLDISRTFMRYGHRRWDAV